jgi:hypothetical protein
MRSNIAMQIRRVLLAAGAPLLPIGCVDQPKVDPDAAAVAKQQGAPDGSTPVATSQPSPETACVGGWGEEKREGGCRSGPYEGTFDRHLPLDLQDARQVALYKSCREGFLTSDCPVELCERVVAYKAKDDDMISERFGKFLKCAPACRVPGQPGVHVVYTVAGSCTGRRPEGLRSEHVAQASNEIGALFAHMARLEAASVFAFERLTRELIAHAAPEPLIVAAMRSIVDEARHYRMVGALASRFGSRAPIPDVETAGVRSLEEVVIENAVEGCVGETFGAAVAAWQARAAGDPVVRAVMRTVARDEREHAKLAWQIDAWASSALTVEARRRVRERRAGQVDELAKSVAGSHVSAAVERLGIPGVDAQMAIVSGLDQRLWRKGSSVRSSVFVGRA